MAPGLVLALASLAVGAGELRLDAGLHLDGRGRVVSPHGGSADETLEALAMPHVAAEWILPDVRLAGSYAPRLRLPDLTRNTDLVVLHGAELRATTRPDAAWRLSAMARGERGTTDLLTESHQAGTELQTITTTSRLRYQAARGGLGLTGKLDARTALTLGAGAFVEGGDGPRAEAISPIQRGVRAEAGLGWIATRLDRLGLHFAALGTRLERGPTSGVVSLDASWRRRFTRTVDGWLGAGAAGTYEDPRGGVAERRLLPSGELGVSHTPPAPQPTSGEEGAPARETPAPRISSQAVVRLYPIIDRATGAVDPEVEASLRASWPVTPRWTLGANAIGAILRQSAGDSRLGRLEAQATWAANTWAHLGAGMYGSVQRATSPALPSFDEAGIYLSVDLDAPTQKP